MAQRYRRRTASVRPTWLLLLGVATALAFPSLAAARGHAHQHAVNSAGNVYTETNQLTNQVVVFKRSATGALEEMQRIGTGGAGSLGNQPFGQDFLDSNNAVELSGNGKLLFVVNAGSDSISSFRVGHKGKLKFADQKPSGGDNPTSVDTHKGLLYAFNVDSNDISGFRYSKKGKLKPIANSTQQLATPNGTNSAGFPEPFADQVIFSPNGKVLIVPERLSNNFQGQLDTFAVDSDGRAGPVHSNASNGVIPFGLAWDNHGHLVVANGGPPPNFSPGSASTYGLSGTTLTPIDNKTAGADATCWVVVTKDGKYAFMANQPPGQPGSVSRFSISSSGQLTLLGVIPTSGAAADMALSRDSRYLYVQNIGPPMTTDKAKIDVYRVKGGTLKHLAVVDSNVPGSASGLAAR